MPPYTRAAYCGGPASTRARFSGRLSSGAAPLVGANGVSSVAGASLRFFTTSVVGVGAGAGAGAGAGVGAGVGAGAGAGAGVGATGTGAGDAAVAGAWAGAGDELAAGAGDEVLVKYFTSVFGRGRGRFTASPCRFPLLDERSWSLWRWPSRSWSR